MNNKIKELLDTKLKDIYKSANYAIVIKGIPTKYLEDVFTSEVDVDVISKNKLQYFIEVSGKRNIYTYEEFLLLNTFMIAQYSTIYILVNNMFIEQFPLYFCCSEATKTGLLNHFTESDDIDTDSSLDIGDIDEIIALFTGVSDTKYGLIGAYCDKSILSDNKIETIKLFESNNYQLPCIGKSNDFIDIIEESDFTELICRFIDAPGDIDIRVSNYTGDSYLLKEHLEIFAYNYVGRFTISIFLPERNNISFNHREDYTLLLKKYWGYDSYRDLMIYDMNDLENGDKTVIQVSQENIISNIVEQAENCETMDNDFRDIFVTAPTGAGKSVMFQIPAIYLAEKYDLLTIVISPLIGLMNDQVKNLELKNYKYAETINSDISPIIKQDIIEKVNKGDCHILYISPETLLSRSDVAQLIGNRTIGMIVIDEAHIVTTWGKQFRPDYWYLGDHIKMLRKRQLKNKGRAFVIATFTATAIYHGIEDMYSETINSLHMINPITYLGYVKRNDIDIVINWSNKDDKTRSIYDIQKFDDIERIIKRALITNKKTLIYFPTVALIIRCYEYFRAKHMIEQIAVYHGSLSKDEKTESYEKFYNKDKIIMFATKAFGMGIDINDIELIVHFAPTGNVCDYVQEIGRAARREDLQGEAYYQYDSRDFKHINRLHGLSTIKKYQLIEVIKKIDELYTSNLKRGGRAIFTKSRNAMLLDAENFTYIFGNPISDEDDNINKVKTALLLIQKDFEGRIGFSPISVRPVPMFSQGFFEISEVNQRKLQKRYPHCINVINKAKNIYSVRLDSIWHSSFSSMSFPKFKYLLYTKDKELLSELGIDYNAALSVTIDFSDEYSSKFERYWNVIHGYINRCILSAAYISVSEIAQYISQNCNVSKYKAQTICEVLIASMNSYRKNYSKSMAPIAKENISKDGNTKYQFTNAVNSYFSWIKNTFKTIINETVDGELYLVNDDNNFIKEVSAVLGILEVLDVLSFKMLGGANSQIYIYVNQISELKNILNNPAYYKNRLLDMVSERHLISVKMLTYLYENEFKSEDIWNHLENYFLGTIPESVKNACLKERPNMKFE